MQDEMNKRFNDILRQYDNEVNIQLEDDPFLYTFFFDVDHRDQQYLPT